MCHVAAVCFASVYIDVFNFIHTVASESRGVTLVSLLFVNKNFLRLH